MREDEPHSTEGEYMQSPKGFVGEGRDRNLFSLLNGLGQEPVFLLAAAALLLTISTGWSPTTLLPVIIITTSEYSAVANRCVSTVHHYFFLAIVAGCQMGIRQEDATSGPPLFCCFGCSNVMLLQRNYHTKTE